jgi:hypothetical protein
MAPSDRRKPGEGEPQPTQNSQQPELSSRGKVVIRSSSHPPGAETPITDPPPQGEGALGDPQRAKKDTPAERPRKRRKVQAEQLAREQAEADAAVRGQRSSEIAAQRAAEDRRLWWVLVGLGVAAGAVYVLTR